jgi:hypothetical protein
MLTLNMSYYIQLKIENNVMSKKHHIFLIKKQFFSSSDTQEKRWITYHTCKYGCCRKEGTAEAILEANRH